MAPGGRTGIGGKRGETVLFLALIALHLIPVWAFSRFPSQDGPTHLENAQILREYNLPGRTAFRDYYTLNTRLNPNWFTHLILAGLLWIFPPSIAEKVFLSGYVILLPLSARYALRALSPDSGFLALLSFPFIYNYLLDMGFYNFVYSLPVFFLVVGFWLKRRGALSPAATAGLALLNLLLYFCHLISLVMAAGFIALMGIALAGIDLARRLRRPSTGPNEAARVRLLPGFIAIVPALLLATVFLSRSGTETVAGPPAGELVKSLLRLESLDSRRGREILLSSALAALFGAMALYQIVRRTRERRLEAFDALLLVVGLYVAAYFTAPEQISGGGYVVFRLNLFPFLALLLWLGAQKWNRPARGILRVAAALLVVAILTSRALGYAAIDDQMREYLSATDFIESNSTLLPLCFSPFGRGADGGTLSGRVQVFRHTGGYIAAERRVVDLDNYEASTDYFPIAFRPGKDPAVHLAVFVGGIESSPPCVDLHAYAERTGGSVDYVLMWDFRGDEPDDECLRLTLDQIRSAYDLVNVSRAGRMKLYRRKGFTSPEPSRSR